jgi:hypothetical protein
MCVAGLGWVGGGGGVGVSPAVVFVVAVMHVVGGTGSRSSGGHFVFV